MKNSMKYVGFMAALMSLLYACAPTETQDKALIYTPAEITAGQKVDISYDATKTNLAGQGDVDGVVYLWQDWHWVAKDVTLEKKHGLWKASIHVPEDAGLIAMKFVAGDSVDCGGPLWSYVQLTLDTAKQNLPSAYMAWGMLRNQLFKGEYGIPGYVQDSTLIGDDVMLYWCNMELKYHPTERKDVMYFAAKTIAALDKKESLPVVRKDVENLMGLDSIIHDEKYLVRGIEIANSVLHDQNLATTLEEYALATYPKGIVARDKEIWRIFRMADADEKAQAMAQYVKDYPYEVWKDIDTFTSEMYLGKNFQSVVYMPIMQNDDYSLLDTYLHELPYDYLYTFFWHMVQIPYRNKQATAEKLLPIGQILLDESFNRAQTKKQLVYSSKEWQKYQYKYRQEALLDWAMILDETGSTEKAMEWMTILEPLYKGKVEKFSTFYVAMLEKTGNAKKALEVAKLAVENNAASPEILELLKVDFVKQNGDDKGFETYIQSLKPSELDKKHEEEIKASFVEKPIELYQLETLEGETLDMADFKGKVIILDFWATWCAPCKAAMPGMNMAYQKYKDDNDVAFFFISTMEHNKDFKEKIHAFMKEKGYDFTVLLDVENPETHKGDFVYSQYAKAFQFSGIPQKIIIGPDGNLRWRSTGYNGSPSALADEISFIIEYLKSDS